MKDSFTSILIANYNTYCQHHGINPSAFALVDFLLESNVIQKTEIHHYVVLFEFASLLQMGTYKNKTQTIKAIADRYNLHENTIWNILKDHKDKFQLSAGIPA